MNRGGAILLASSEPRSLLVGLSVRPSALWRRRYYDCWLWHWRSRPGQAPLAWSGVVEDFFTDEDGTRCVVVRHPEEDCGCGFKTDCWRCAGDGVTTRRALPIEEIERTI